VYISLKKGRYVDDGTAKIDEFGTRTYFFYSLEQIEELAGKKFDIVEKSEQNLHGQDWFTIVLRKK
jgi:hypothetical protein